VKVVRARDRLRGDVWAPTGRFHGHSLQHLLHESEDRTRASFIRFDQDARTQWHTHSGGQVLHILEGKASVQAWGEALQTLRAGDTAITPPGEKHWHGARGEKGMTQLSITSGEITWLEDVETD
jgi:quercetin dioxygenase-like cupin family protein